MIKWIAILWLIVLWAFVLFGCASNDPVPPIQYYRQQHGFPVT
jgi:hypothetical protein